MVNPLRRDGRDRHPGQQDHEDQEVALHGAGHGPGSREAAHARCRGGEAGTRARSDRARFGGDFRPADGDDVHRVAQCGDGRARGGAHDDDHRARLQPRLGTRGCGDVSRAHGHRTDTQPRPARTPARRGGRGCGPGARCRRAAASHRGRRRYRRARAVAPTPRRAAGLAGAAARRLGDFKAALGVFLLVVAATFPVVVPFIFLDRAALAVRVSNFVALGMLFLCGWILARYAGGSRWRGAASMTVVGALLMAAIMALGG